MTMSVFIFGGNMKIKNKLFYLMVAIISCLFMSCSTIGNHLPIAHDEIVIGTIQTTFIARNTWIANKKSINTHIYLKLLEAAVQKFSGDIDIRDIVWVTGRKVTPLDTEISATGKVIRANSNEN